MNGSCLDRLVGNLNERKTRPVEIPGHDGAMVRVWALTNTEETWCRKRAYDFVQTQLKFSALDLEYDQQRALNDAIVAEILSRALRNPDAIAEPFASDAQAVRDKLTTGDLAFLYNEYLTHCEERAALKDVADPEAELDALLDLVAQGFLVGTRLSRYASPSLRPLLSTALDRLASGMKPSSSGGSPPAATASPSSPAG